MTELRASVGGRGNIEGWLGNNSPAAREREEEKSSLYQDYPKEKGKCGDVPLSIFFPKKKQSDGFIFDCVSLPVKNL